MKRILLLIGILMFINGCGVMVGNMDRVDHRDHRDHNMTFNQ